VMLVHTGAKISTASALSSLSPKEVWVRRLSDSAEGFLKDQNWTDAMNEHDQLLRELGVVPKECQELLQYWKQKKWIEAGKTTGAGGGDALLLYVVPEALRALQEDVEKRGFWFQRATWESEGLRVEKAQ